MSKQHKRSSENSYVAIELFTAGMSAPCADEQREVMAHLRMPASLIVEINALSERLDLPPHLIGTALLSRGLEAAHKKARRSRLKIIAPEHRSIADDQSLSRNPLLEPSTDDWLSALGLTLCDSPFDTDDEGRQ